MQTSVLEILISGNILFTLSLFLLFGYAIYLFVKKTANHQLEDVQLYNEKIHVVGQFLIAIGFFSLSLGLLQGLNAMSQAGGVAPAIVYRGIATALATPTLSLALYIVCLILKSIMNATTKKSTNG